MKKIKKLKFSGSSQVLTREQLKMVLGGDNGSGSEPGGSSSGTSSDGLTNTPKFKDTSGKCYVHTQGTNVDDYIDDVAQDYVSTDHVQD